jgi:hypothetical protein
MTRMTHLQLNLHLELELAVSFNNEQEEEEEIVVRRRIPLQRHRRIKVIIKVCLEGIKQAGLLKITHPPLYLANLTIRMGVNLCLDRNLLKIHLIKALLLPLVLIFLLKNHLQIHQIIINPPPHKEIMFQTLFQSLLRKEKKKRRKKSQSNLNQQEEECLLLLNQHQVSLERLTPQLLPPPLHPQMVSLNLLTHPPLHRSNLWRGNLNLLVKQRRSSSILNSWTNS